MARRREPRQGWWEAPPPPVAERRLVRRTWGDFDVRTKVVAKAIHDGWHDEALLQVHFVGLQWTDWAALPEWVRVVFCAMAEAALWVADVGTTVPLEEKRRLRREADPWTYLPTPSSSGDTGSRPSDGPRA